MNNTPNVLGWGIIGTPKGRQASGDGLDKELKLADSYDLPQEFCGYLPSPTQRDFTPLYCLQFRIKNNKSVLSLAEYRPIFEQGQTRGGSYFGAFIETANLSFGENSAKSLVESLFELSSYQSSHFIDAENTRYKESISGKPFDPPSKLELIANDLTALKPNILTKTVATSSVYIPTRPEELIDTLKSILREQLYYQYEQIFFSESVYIATQISSRTLKLSANALIHSNSFIIPFRNEIGYLHRTLEEQKQRLEKTEKELKHLKDEQNVIIQQRISEKEDEYRKIVLSYQENESIYQHNEIIYQQEEVGYKQKIAELEKKIIDKENELKDEREKIFSLKSLIDYGKDIQQYHNNINSKLKNIDTILRQQSTIESTVNDIKRTLDSVKPGSHLKSQNLPPHTQKKKKSSNKMWWIVGGVLSILFLVILTLGIFWYIHDTPNLTSTNSNQESASQMSNKINAKETMPEATSAEENNTKSEINEYKTTAETPSAEKNYTNSEMNNVNETTTPKERQSQSKETSNSNSPNSKNSNANNK